MLAGVPEEGAFAAHAHEILIFEFFEMMRQRGIGDAQLVLDFAHDQTLRVGREQQLHDAEPGLGSHGGEHVGVAGDLFGRPLFHYFYNSRNTDEGLQEVFT